MELSIPKTSTAPKPKPHTIYHITIRLPLRSVTIAKRYSDFTALNEQLTSLVGSPPPISLPPKSYFSSTVSNPQFAETRRAGLEKYLVEILTCTDSRWRSSPAWRQFLNLPSSSSSATTTAATRSTQSTTAAVTDPVLWLDFHRELKTLLQDARFELTRRDQATAISEQHDASASSKKNLIKASTLISILDAGLKDKDTTNNSSNQLGDGELRRRRDLVSAAKNERDALEVLANSIAKQSSNSSSASELKSNRYGQSVNNNNISNTNNSLFKNGTKNGGGGGGGRVLGGPLPETERTRELNNTGVLQLQKQIIQDQNQDLSVLLQSVSKQKQMGLAIGEELEYQNDLLNALDADVDRVDGKLKVVKKRMNKLKYIVFVLTFLVLFSFSSSLGVFFVFVLFYICY